MFLGALVFAFVSKKTPPRTLCAVLGLVSVHQEVSRTLKQRARRVSPLVETRHAGMRLAGSRLPEKRPTGGRRLVGSATVGRPLVHKVSRFPSAEAVRCFEFAVWRRRALFVPRTILGYPGDPLHMCEPLWRQSHVVECRVHSGLVHALHQCFCCLLAACIFDLRGRNSVPDDGCYW